MNVIYTWLRLLDRPSPKIDVVFFDFTKAFDLMPHDVLLRKLKSRFFISGKLWFWIQSLLTNRQQRVLYKGTTSTWFQVLSGIPRAVFGGPAYLIYSLMIFFTKPFHPPYYLQMILSFTGHYLPPMTNEISRKQYIIIVYMLGA